MNIEEAAREKLARGLISVDEWRAAREEHLRSLELPVPPEIQQAKVPAARLSHYLQSGQRSPEDTCSDLGSAPPKPPLVSQLQQQEIEDVTGRVEILEKHLRENDASFASTLERLVGEFLGRIKRIEDIQAAVMIENDVLVNRVRSMESAVEAGAEVANASPLNKRGMKDNWERMQKSTGTESAAGSDHFPLPQQVPHASAIDAADRSWSRIRKSVDQFKDPCFVVERKDSVMSGVTDFFESSDDDSNYDETVDGFNEAEDGNHRRRSTAALPSPDMINEDLPFSGGGWYSPKEMRNLLRFGSVSNVLHSSNAPKPNINATKKKNMPLSISDTKNQENSKEEGAGEIKVEEIKAASNATNIAGPSGLLGGHRVSSYLRFATTNNDVDEVSSTDSSNSDGSDISEDRTTDDLRSHISETAFIDVESLLCLDCDILRISGEQEPSGTLLVKLATQLANRYGFLRTVSDSSKDGFMCEVSTFDRWIESVAAGYDGKNRYHNSLHAADVMVTANAYLEHSGILSLPEPAEDKGWSVSRFALLAASAVHDVNHPARMNPFMKSTKNPLILPYIEESGVLEAMHAARFLEITRMPGHDILEYMGGSADRTRQVIVDLVLATDLTKQGEILGEWNSKKVSTADAQSGAAAGAVEGWSLDASGNASDRLLMMKMLLKAADVSNPAKSLPLYLFWTNRIMEEFYDQGDEEKRMGIPVSAMPQCDRSKPALAGGQKGFISFVVKPTFDALAGFSSAVIKATGKGGTGLQWAMDSLDSNLEFWKEIETKVTAEMLAATCLPSDLPIEVFPSSLTQELQSLQWTHRNTSASLNTTGAVIPLAKIKSVSGERSKTSASGVRKSRAYQSAYLQTARRNGRSLYTASAPATSQTPLTESLDEVAENSGTNGGAFDVGDDGPRPRTPSLGTVFGVAAPRTFSVRTNPLATREMQTTEVGTSASESLVSELLRRSSRSDQRLGRLIHGVRQRATSSFSSTPPSSPSSAAAAGFAFN